MWGQTPSAVHPAQPGFPDSTIAGLVVVRHHSKTARTDSEFA